MHFAPPLVQFCAYSPDVQARHLESLKYVMIGAAPVGETLALKFKEKAPNCIFREGKMKEIVEKSTKSIKAFNCFSFEFSLV